MPNKSKTQDSTVRILLYTTTLISIDLTDYQQTDASESAHGGSLQLKEVKPIILYPTATAQITINFPTIDHGRTSDDKIK